MLEELRLRGLGVIDEAVLELGPGLTVVTGETGAGKTMVVQGLALLFGGRADAGLVRAGAGRAVVEGRVLLPAGHPALQRAEEAGAELDAGALLVSRTIGADGRSRAYLGGRAVPAGVLAEVGEQVLALHGQSDQLRLLRPAGQRDALDRYADLLGARQRFGQGWTRWRQVREEHAALRAAAAERLREAELLRAGLAEIEAAAPGEHELAELEEDIERLAHADDLRAAATLAQQALTGSEADLPDAVGLVGTARRALAAVSGHDPVLAEVAERVGQAEYLLADAAGDLARYADNVDADPLRLSAAQERLAVLRGLLRRYGCSDVPGLLGWAEDSAGRLAELEGTDERIAALAEQDRTLAAELGSAAAALSAARTDAAERFGTAVGAELAGLAMPTAQVQAQVRQRADPDGLEVAGQRLAAGPEGVDEVELLLVPHPGAPARPVHRGASGGELSRVMLAVEVVFAGADPLPVLVFDEVDAGVGGRAAVEVGRRLARLARDHQVLVVTHLPQVAAFADRHLVVVKDAGEQAAVTASGVRALSDPERVAELSRMLAGLDSGLARGHAEELLAAAAAAKA